MNEKQTQGNIMKVVELGIQDKVYNAMKQPKFSVEALTRQLNSDGVDITAQSIRKFIKNTKKAQSELISRDLRAVEEYKQLTMDYSTALQDILSEVEEVKLKTKNDKDYATYNQMVGRLMQGIELIAKLTGDIKPKGSVDITLIYNQINEDVSKEKENIRTAIFKEKIIDIDAEILEDDKQTAKIIQGEN